MAVQAGQQLTHLRLQPGERIRTPRITVMAWVGEPWRALNLWRRWYRAHVMPASEGRPLPSLLAVSGTDAGEEFTGATEGTNSATRTSSRASDSISMSGGSMPAGIRAMNEQSERKWWLTGTWYPDPERFPNGLRPIAENAARHGARLLLWLEPERVTRGSALFREHPEWLLR